MTPEEAIELYDQALVDFRDAAAAVIAAGQERDDAKQALAGIEAGVAANGGWGEMAIDGKNAETRAAQLAVILAKHPEHIRCTGSYRQASSRLARAEYERDQASETMRFCRAVLVYETARLQREAYAHGGEPIGIR